MSRANHISRRPRRRPVRSGERQGFTLVEMLVAVGLVVLMMTLFAQVFQLAAGSLSTQRGIAENDQRTRMLETIIRADLENRTFKYVYPWAAGEDTDSTNLTGKRRGYFYISENNLNNDGDDVLQFTAELQDADLRFIGRATQLGGDLLTHFNQPETDDGNVAPDGAGESPAAEICYFLRNGNLYRRVLLIREPIPIGNAGAQPTDADGNDFFTTSEEVSGGATAPVGGLYETYTAPIFWNDFDYSAYFSGTLAAPGGAQFHSSDSLSNGGDGGFFSLGKPRFRFGHSPLGGPTVIGSPREYFDTATTSFMGRFTHQETSDPDFLWPHRPATAGATNPMSRSAATLADADGDFVADVFSDGGRRAEDLLLSNVLSMDVKVWDPAVNGFADIGHSFTDDGTPTGTPIGHYNQLNNWHQLSLTTTRTDIEDLIPGTVNGVQYGPQSTASANRVFDTWHPQVEFDATTPANVDMEIGTGTADPPPFRPQVFSPDDGTDGGVALGNTGFSALRPLWRPETTYSAGDVVFPRTRLENGWPFFYRCVVAGDSANDPDDTADTSDDGTNEPRWPEVPGLQVEEGPLDVGASGPPVVWVCEDNRLPLQAVQITIRFLDVTSDQIRQATFVVALND